MSDPGLDLPPVRRPGASGSRYTSYPTPDRFTGAFDAKQYALHARRRHLGGQHRRLSLYINVPFCGDAFLHAGCEKVVAADRSRAPAYLAHLERELSMQSELHRPGGLAVDQIYLAGGSPTFLGLSRMRGLMKAVRRSFRLADDRAGDFAIEVDPRCVRAPTVRALRAIGFNRMSIGLQGFDPGTQRDVKPGYAFQRMKQQTAGVVRAARAEGFRSINIDLVLGQLGEVPGHFEQALSAVIDLAPDRIALYGHAQLAHRIGRLQQPPEVRRSGAESGPDMREVAARRLGEAGYRYIGIDLFAVPGDDLAVAQDRGRLGLNLIGYTPHPDTDVIGIGVSAPGSVGASYSQNAVDLDAYCAALDAGELPVARGIELHADDLLRRTVIQGLICHRMLHLPSIEQAYLIDFQHYFAGEMAQLAAFQSAGLVTIEPGNKPEWITVSPRGQFFLRQLCMLFDRRSIASRPQPEVSASGQ